MKETVLEKNLNKISKYNPELAKKIAAHCITENDYHLEEAKSGDSILYKGDIPSDDPIDPVWATLDEYKKIENENKSTESVTVILGIGLGYTLKEISKRTDSRIILHEPNLDFLRIALELTDFSEEPDDKIIIITNTYDDIEKAFHSVFFFNYPINLVHSHYYLKYERPYSQTFKTKLTEIYGIFQSNYKNLFEKNRMWTVAVFENISEIVKNQDFHVLKNKFKDKTAVIISAGPSLDKNIQELKPYRDKVIVFCVGTALKAALKNGIIPDFVNVLEQSSDTEIQLNVPEISDINIIAANTTYNPVFKLKPRRFFNYYGFRTPVSKWFGTILGVPTEIYDEAGTVALSCFYSAKMLGCKKIIFIGQDLAYTGNRCYSKNSVYNGYILDDSGNVITKNTEEKTILNRTESMAEDHLKLLTKDLIQIKGQDGNLVLTRPDFLLFIKYFEKIAQNLGSELTLVNATEGGAFLEGFEHISLKEALKKYTDENNINVEKIINNYKLMPKDIIKRRKIVAGILNEIFKNCRQTYDIISNSLEKNIFPYFGEIKDLPCPQREEELYKKMNNLFNDSPEKFAENFKLVKEDYLRINYFSEQNPYMRNYFINCFLQINQKILTFKNTDENLITLSKMLNDNIFAIYIGWPGFIKFIDYIREKLNKTT